MDDMKLLARNDRELVGLLKLLMTSEWTLTLISVAKQVSIKLDTNTIIKELNPQVSYKYLEINEEDVIQHDALKEKTRKEYYRRIGLIQKVELNSKNLIKAINT